MGLKKIKKSIKAHCGVMDALYIETTVCVCAHDTTKLVRIDNQVLAGSPPLFCKKKKNMTCRVVKKRVVKT